MGFIDRLLQSRRIVTKVLLFVIPLILLIAGVGLLGYKTATMLNGHMTVTRATIGNISDLETLQAALQEFSLDPSAERQAALLAAVDRQEAGLAVLDGVLSAQAHKADLSALRALSAAMRDQTAAMATNKQGRDRLDADLSTAVDRLQTDGAAIVKQIDFVRQDLSAKERFAKELLFDASAFKTLLDRLGKLRVGVQMGFTPQEQLAEAKLYVEPLQRDIVRAEAIVSEKGKVRVGEVSAAVGQIDAILKSTDNDDTRAQSLNKVLAELVLIEQNITLQAAKNADIAADRFVSLDKLVADQRELMGLVDQVALEVASLELRIEQLRTELSDDSRSLLMANLDAVTKMAARISELGAKNNSLRDFASKVAPSVKTIETASDARLQAEAEWQSLRLDANQRVSAAMASLRDFVSQAQEIGREDSERSATISVVTMVVGTLLAIIGALMLIETLRGPLKRITGVMTRLAGGDLSIAIDGRERGDEIGDMVRSVTVFRDAALENRRLEEEATAARARSEQEGQQRTAERARVEADQRAALQALSTVLEALADGQLNVSMRDDLPADFVAMAGTYNKAVEALRATLEEVRGASIDINAGTTNLASQADDLARRTEQQAAALEESVRALSHLSSVVSSTADGAGRTAHSVNAAREQARQSGEVVRKAVAAMAEIHQSSGKISTIIGVIDEIAFQTNLLALNAGVEAARAGEAGRGFAVVAQEVRDLAQRCANAAKEIKALIQVSGSQVQTGVALVENTGVALQAIIDQVEEVQALVESISSATREQSTGISEVTTAVRDVERITQRNAAMVEENNAEIHGLRQRVEILMQKIARFSTDVGQADRSRQRRSA
ncbi:methyl-accepting chemotaxis protein [Rhizobium sp. G187]|uniref:methyl-accepting chemotaxis protein n=1 Tax=Rhizobium sp. G187 TaxID=3451352 RepID=UPI003EE4B8F2